MPTATAKKAEPVVIHSAEFSWDHDTKGAMQYKEDYDGDGRPPIGSLYLTKAFLATVKGPNTRKLRVTVEAIG